MLHDKKRILFLYMQSGVEKGGVLVDSGGEGKFSVVEKKERGG